MKPRATRDLTQLADPAFFSSVAEGLELIVKNIGRLWDGAAALGESGQSHASRVLAVMAEEEAAKYLILLDAIRCPRQPSDRFSDQLARFGSHLAKGIYARVCWTRPSTLADLQGYVNHYRDEFYLDGPNDVDWIFRNEIDNGREGAFYVDYVATDEGHHWSDPSGFEDFLGGALKPQAVTMAQHLDAAGFSNAAALSLVADLWRQHVPEDDTQWNEIVRLNRQTLELLEERTILAGQPAEIYSHIVNEWQFPMYVLDMTLRKVARDELRQRQRAWSPDW